MEKKFGFTVIKLLHRNQLDDNNRIDLMVIKWSSAKTPVLENRRMFRDKKTGEWMFRKNAGFSENDLDIIINNKDEIRSLLTSTSSEDKNA